MGKGNVAGQFKFLFPFFLYPYYYPSLYNCMSVVKIN